MASSSVVLRAEAQDSLAFGSIVAGYTKIGNAFEHSMRIIHIQNVTDALLQFSFDGIVDHFPLPSNSFLLLDVCTNQSNTSGFFIAKGTQMYVKRIGIPSTGSVYVSTYYGKGN